MIKLTDEYRALSKNFKKCFGYGVPLSMIPQTADMNELVKNIEECIANNKDNLLEKYNISNDDGVLY